MLKNVIQVVDFEHRKVHFLESDFFASATRRSALSFSKRALSFSKSAHLTWEFVLFSKMVLALDVFALFSLSKQWKFMCFCARRLEI